MGGLNVTAVRRDRIPLFLEYSKRLRESVLAEGFCSNMGYTKYPVFRRMKLP